MSAASSPKSPAKAVAELAFFSGAVVGATGFGCALASCGDTLATGFDNAADAGVAGDGASGTLPPRLAAIRARSAKFTEEVIGLLGVAADGSPKATETSLPVIPSWSKTSCRT